jgi:hypothetical protein
MESPFIKRVTECDSVNMSLVARQLHAVCVVYITRISCVEQTKLQGVTASKVRIGLKSTFLVLNWLDKHDRKRKGHPDWTFALLLKSRRCLSATKIAYLSPLLFNNLVTRRKKLELSPGDHMAATREPSFLSHEHQNFIFLDTGRGTAHTAGFGWRGGSGI